MSIRYTEVFFRWAREHGFPERGPKGSEVNLIRALMLPKLVAQYNREQKVKAND